MVHTKLASLVLAAALFALPAVAAVPDGGDSMNALCQAKDFDFGIAKWQYGGNGPWVQVDSIPGYTTSVTGDKSSASWTSDPLADGVLTNGASTVFAGNDSATKGVNHNGNIEQVTFCGNDVEIPEFGTLAAGVAIAGALAGLVAFRKRN